MIEYVLKGMMEWERLRLKEDSDGSKRREERDVRSEIAKLF